MFKTKIHPSGCSFNRGEMFFSRKEARGKPSSSARKRTVFPANRYSGISQAIHSSPSRSISIRASVDWVST